MIIKLSTELYKLLKLGTGGVGPDGVRGWGYKWLLPLSVQSGVNAVP